MSINHENAMKIAIEESKYNKNNNYTKGGPFGACIIKNGEIICSAHNTVIESMDPTAHAEINAIRKACNIMRTHNLEGCTLYTSSEPCPMCLSAIIWSNIRIIYFANSVKDAEDIGYKDNIIYEYIKGNNNIVNLNRIENEEAIQVFKEFKIIENKNIY